MRCDLYQCEKLLNIYDLEKRLGHYGWTYEALCPINGNGEEKKECETWIEILGQTRIIVGLYALEACCK